MSDTPMEVASDIVGCLWELVKWVFVFTLSAVLIFAVVYTWTEILDSKPCYNSIAAATTLSDSVRAMARCL